MSKKRNKYEMYKISEEKGSVESDKGTGGLLASRGGRGRGRRNMVKKFVHLHLVRVHSCGQHIHSGGRDIAIEGGREREKEKGFRKLRNVVHKDVKVMYIHLSEIRRKSSQKKLNKF
jgi:hypothetical protein